MPQDLGAVGQYQATHGFSTNGLPGRADTLSIALKELVPIILAAIVWGFHWSGKLIQFNYDNEAVVLTLNSLLCKDKGLLSLLRCMIFIVAKYSFWFLIQ